MKINSELYRLTEVELLFGDSNKTLKAINLEPKVSFKDLVKNIILLY